LKAVEDFTKTAQPFCSVSFGICRCYNGFFKKGHKNIFIFRGKTVEFIDLKSQQKLIRKDIDSRIAAVLDHGQYILGPEIAELEQKLASFVGVKHCRLKGLGNFSNPK